MTYEEYKSRYPKPYKDSGSKCFINGCEELALYEGGDARFWCGVCEKHAGILKSYRIYLDELRRKIICRMLWCKKDPTFELLYDEVSSKLKETLPLMEEDISNCRHYDKEDY